MIKINIFFISWLFFFQLNSQIINLTFDCNDCKDKIDSILIFQEVKAIKMFLKDDVDKKSDVINIILADSLEKYSKKYSSSLNGFYRQSNNTIYIKNNSVIVKTFKHEYTHKILLDLNKNIDIKINEGIAECIENSSIFNDSLNLNLNLIKAKKILYKLKIDRMYTDRFIDFTNEKWHENNKAPFFFSSAFSWGIIIFLYLEQKVDLIDLINLKSKEQVKDYLEDKLDRNKLNLFFYKIVKDS